MCVHVVWDAKCVDQKHLQMLYLYIPGAYAGILKGEFYFINVREARAKFCGHAHLLDDHAHFYSI